LEEVFVRLIEQEAERERPVPLGNDWEVIRRGGLCGFRNAGTGETIDPVYDAAGPFSEGMAPVRVGRRWFYVDHRGRNVLDGALYDGIEPFYEGLAVVRKGERYGFIDPAGKIVVPLLWEEARRFSQERACVRKEGKYGFIDLSGHPVIPPAYDSAFDFREGLAVVGRQGRYGYIDRQGRVKIAPVFRFASGFRRGEATAEAGTDGCPLRLIRRGEEILVLADP
jgi:hypothetical protein